MSIPEDKEDINYYGPYMNLFPIGDVYIAVPNQEKVLGMSPLSASDKVVPVGLSADSPHPILPSFYVTNLHLFTDLGLTSGGLAGVAKKGKYVLINVQAFTFALNQRFHEIMMSVLDNWSESVKEQARLTREKLLSDEYLDYLNDLKISIIKSDQEPIKMSPTDYKRYLMDTTVFSDWIKSLPPEEQIVQRNLGRRYQILTGMETALNSYRESLQNHGPSKDSSTILSNLAVGSTAAGEYVGYLSGGAQAANAVGLNSINSAIAQMSKPLVDKNAAALGYFGALFGTGTVYQTSNELSLNVGRLEDKEMSEKFAHQYAKNLSKLLKTDDFNLFLNASVINLQDNGRSISEKDRQQLVDAMKFVLLIAALAVVYKSETKKLTDMEIGAMLIPETEKGAIPVSDDPVKQALKDQILNLWGGLGNLQKPMTLAALAYVDTDPDMKDLTDTYKVFEGIRQTEELSEAVHTRDLLS